MVKGSVIKVNAFNLAGAAILFRIPAAWFYMATCLITPWLTDQVGLHPLLSWFITGLMVFPLLFALALILARREGFRSILNGPMFVMISFGRDLHVPGMVNDQGKRECQTGV